MRIISIAIFVFSIAIIQAALFVQLKIFGVFPNLVLVLIILLGLISTRQKAFIAALTGGLTLDFLSIMPFGTFTILLIIISLISNLLKYYLFTHANFLIISTSIFIGTIFYDILFVFLVRFFLLLHLTNLDISAKHILLEIMPVEIVYNLVCAAGIFLLLKATLKPLIV